MKLLVSIETDFFFFIFLFQLGFHARQKMAAVEIFHFRKVTRKKSRNVGMYTSHDFSQDQLT